MNATPAADECSEGNRNLTIHIVNGIIFSIFQESRFCNTFDELSYYTHTQVVCLHHYAPILPERFGTGLVKCHWAAAITVSPLCDLLI